MPLHRATHADIDLAAFRHNVGMILELVGPEVKVMAVVKADGYGHGAVPCAREALKAGAYALGVAVLEEGIELRQNGIEAPILVLTGVFPEEIPDLLEHNLSTTLSHPALVQAISEKACAMGKTAGIHLKIETGMGRLGVPREELSDLAEQISGAKNLHIEGVCTHFATADDPDPEFTEVQLARFEEALQLLESQNFVSPLKHTANAAALIKFPESRFNMVRPGIALYGAMPSPAIKPVFDALPKTRLGKGFHPVMHWKTRILQINPVKKGHPLSYGRKFVTQRDSLIAVLPVGYGDGLNRGLSNNMSVLVRGKRALQVGSICMDLTLIDVTDIPGVHVGDEVVLFGKQEGQFLPVEEMAEAIDTIPYEILCNVGKRVPRVYRS
jgi:alanine racemase